MRGIIIQFLLIFSGLTFHQTVSAQCSEAQNSDMAKYAELTRTGDAQGCSMCAWLANLYCIAENGLYENDKAELEKSIQDTKSNIQMMGDPICCPELLTKSIKWGNPSSSSESGSNGAVENKAAADFQEVMNEINHSVQTVQNLNLMEESYQELEKNLKKVESEIVKNANLENFDYSTSSEIENVYNAKLSNLNELGKIHLEIRKRMSELGHAGANELINSEASGLGAVAKLGAFVDTFSYKKESEAFSDRAKEALSNSRSNYLFKLKNKDVEFTTILTQEKLNDYFNDKVYSGNLDEFSNNSIIPGFKMGIKLKEFKKLIPNFKWKYISPNVWLLQNYGGENQFLFSMGKKQLIGEIGSYKIENIPFSVENLSMIQKEIMDEIKYFDELFQMKPYSYEVININETGSELINSVDSGVRVIWTDENNKLFAYTALIFKQPNSDDLQLKISRVERNLQTPVVASSFESFYKGEK